MTAPSSDPVTVDELKAHLRVTTDEEDATLASYITAAREYIERQTGRALGEQVRETSADAFPRGNSIPLGFAPVVSIESVKYIDPDGVEQTLTEDSYLEDTRSEPGHLVLAPGKSWPIAAQIPSSVRIGYKCGIQASATMKQAVLFLAAHWAEQRVPVNIGNIVNDIPHSLDALIWSNRVLCP